MATRGIERTNLTDGASHEGFLRHKGFFWGKIATLLCLIAIVAYMLIDVEPRPNGGSWYGYILGTIGALQILWLTMLGVRKRAITRKKWSLKAWTSAHVYLGLSLIVIATLHTGFQFDWNIHTLAYVLMMLVILSGIYGVSAYAFAVADSQTVYVTALFFVGFFNLGAWGAVYPFTSETFPTRLRSSAFGLMEGVGKTAAIAGPYIFGNLNDATGSTTWSLTFVAIVMAAGGLVAAAFGRETRGRALA